jgi:hypothetical protein
MILVSNNLSIWSAIGEGMVSRVQKVGDREIKGIQG